MAKNPDQDDLQRLRIEYAQREERLSNNDLYSPFNPSYLFTLQSRQRATMSLLRRGGFYPLGGSRILELGCGTGGVLGEYLGYGVSHNYLFGSDLIYSRVQQAHERLPHLSLTCADGQNLPYPNNSFDLVLQYTVFTSILDQHIQERAACEMLRVVQPDGAILWYDFWLNPTNPQTKGIRPTEIRGLFPNCCIHFHKITLAPPIARRLVPISWALAYILESLRIFNSHYLVLIQPG